MTHRERSKLVFVEGMISPEEGNEGWGDSGILLTSERNSNDVYSIEPDEVGRELSSHVFENVQVSGTVIGRSSGRKILRIKDYQVVDLNSDVFWDVDVENASWEEELYK